MKNMRFLLLIVFVQLCSLYGISQKQFKVLLITATKGWHHESLHYGVLAIKQLGIQHHFDVSVWENPKDFSDKYVASFNAIIFLNTTGDIFDTAQQQVMERFIRSGKGFVGIHSASDTEYDWPWYTQLVGRMFQAHPAIQTARVNVIDSTFPGLNPFAHGKLWTDEWYEFGPEKVKGLKYILSIDESTYKPTGQPGSAKAVGMGKFHPVAWYHEFDGGRSFYTALGHMPSIYSDPAFLEHIYAGIRWAATGSK